MSEITKGLRSAIDRTIDALEMAGFNEGFEAAINALDELSNHLHNEGNPEGSDALSWAAKELRGDNA